MRHACNASRLQRVTLATHHACNPSRLQRITLDAIAAVITVNDFQLFRLAHKQRGEHAGPRCHRIAG